MKFKEIYINVYNPDDLHYDFIYTVIIYNYYLQLLYIVDLY